MKLYICNWMEMKPTVFITFLYRHINLQRLTTHNLNNRRGGSLCTETVSVTSCAPSLFRMFGSLRVHR